MLSISGNWCLPNSNSRCLQQKHASHRIFLQKFDGKWYKYTWWFLSATKGCRQVVSTTCMNIFSILHLLGWSFFQSLLLMAMLWISRITRCSLLVKNSLFEICMITFGHFVTFIVVGSATVWLGFLVHGWIVQVTFGPHCLKLSGLDVPFRAAKETPSNNWMESFCWGKTA